MKKPKTQTLLRSTDHVKPSQLQTKTYIGTVEQTSNTGLTTTELHSTFNTMKTTGNYLKNTGQ